MPWYSRRLVIGGAASAFIALFGVTLVWNTYEQDPSITELRPAAAQLPVAESDAAAVTESASVAVTDSAASLAASAEVPGDATESQVTRPEPARQDRPATPSKLEKESRGVADPRPMAEADSAASEKADPIPDQEISGGLARIPGIAVAPPPAPVEQLDEVVVAGERRALAQSMETKRDAHVSVEEIAVTGARAGSRNRAGYKSAAPPARTGNSLGGLFSRAKKEPEPETGPLPSRVEGRDKFEHFDVNPVKQVADDPVSTFSADVDTASYSFVRKQLDQGVLPQKDAVRAEEMVNYFDYAWPAAEDREQPFRPTIAVSDSPWGKGRKLVHIGIKGYELPARERPDANLVMLLDVSGSMASPDKLPLVQQSMKLLLGSLKPTDKVSIVVYAGAAGQVLAPTAVGEKDKIIAALDSLSPGGSTAGAQGIELAYQLAEQSFRKEGVNRILLCTDGDFNVGIAGTEELKGFVERKRASGIFLSVLGFGQGNYRDELAQALAQNGNGVAAYIDSLAEAQKVLVQEAGSSLFTIAKDVKLQVEFNPATVAEYRLVGYETRALKREDFNNDAIDAGDIGAGHSVTAIYEITPVGVDARMVDESRYSRRRPVVAEGTANEYGFLKIRYKLPEESRSRLIEQPIGLGGNRTGADVQRDVEFSTAVAGFAQLLRGGQFTGSLTYDDVIKAALASRGEDPYGHRNEFVQLVRKAQTARGM